MSTRQEREQLREELIRKVMVRTGKTYKEAEAALVAFFAPAEKEEV